MLVIKKKHKKLKITGLILLAAVAVAVACSLISSYVASLPKLQYEYYAGPPAAQSYPDASFAVISDIHFYDASLGSTGAAFEEVLYSDRKLLLDSEDLLNYAVEELRASGVEFVLVSGDLTKDGERINHEKVSVYLQKLVDAGIKVFVTPGNHDINNPDAVRFFGDTTQSVESVSADEFAALYGNMGFNEALYRDDDSLSYVAEPKPGLWIVALDACRYRENVPGASEIVSGKISQNTERWLSGVLSRSVEEGKAVIVLTHHGVVEHWKGQSKLHPDYLIQDYAYVGRLLASYHVRLAFTGHYHALDIVRGDFDGQHLYDVETGSLVTYPCPVRYCDISGGILSIRTNTIGDKLHPGTDFASNGQAFVKQTVALEAKNTLRKYWVSEAGADYIAEAISDAFVAHYNGDEQTELRPDWDITRLNLWDRLIYSVQAYVAEGLWDDLPPGDNDVRLELN